MKIKKIHLKNAIIVLSILLAVLIIYILSIFLNIFMSNNRVTLFLKDPADITKSSTIIPHPSPSAGKDTLLPYWITFTKQRYSISTPQYWKVYESNKFSRNPISTDSYLKLIDSNFRPNRSGSSNTGMSLEMYETNPSSLDLFETFAQKPLEFKSIIVAGQKAYTRHISDMSDLTKTPDSIESVDTAWISYNTKEYRIELRNFKSELSESEGTALFNEILTTFKFR